uniref:Uncharacterized protein n=1 Tax=Parascaris univalens TaxID=6257 RepID=A0A915A744_PARUN
SWIGYTDGPSSIVVSTPRCGRGDTGSIPALGISDRNSCQRMQKFRFRRRTQPFSTASCRERLSLSQIAGTVEEGWHKS